MKKKTYKTIITAKELSRHLNDPRWAFFDCRFYLQEPERGYQDYLEGHLPGAIYLSLDRDLAGEIIPGKTGRHPLPSTPDLIQRLSSWGIDKNTQVIIYDNESGAFGVRLWWMLNWVGHNRAAVLDGGWKAWVDSGGVIELEESLPERRELIPDLQDHMTVSASFVLNILQDPNYLLLDSRSTERYHGKNETIDSVSGHIPGAKSAPFSDNLTEEGLLKSKEKLRERFNDLFGEHSSANTIVYCGSGVTAAYNILAAVHAGYQMPKLYPGSWSEWITDPTRPVIS